MLSRSFPYGAAAALIMTLGLSAGGWLALNPPSEKQATLTLWTFSRTHHDAFIKSVPDFERAHPGTVVDLQLVSNRAMAARLQAALLAEVDVPDLVEVEIGQAGSLFRGPLNDVGLADLTDRIHASGLWDGMVQARFAPYTSRGRIFGLPHDVHPVQIAYRRDVFEKEGIDADSIKTWDDFIKVGRKLTIPDKRYMVEMSDSLRDQIEVLLFQRGGGYFTPDGRCRLDDQVAIDTMMWYVPLVAGPNRIGEHLGDSQVLTRGVEDGYLLCFLLADWRTRTFERDMSKMSGKLALMPLPAVTAGGRRTSTQGGTMLGITRLSRNQEMAWEFARHIYLERKELARLFRETNILPSLKSAWDQPEFHEPRTYWSGQRLGSLYAALAPDVPFQYTSPFIVTLKNKIGEALVGCVQKFEQDGENGFRDYVRSRMKQSADELRRLMARNPY